MVESVSPFFPVKVWSSASQVTRYQGSASTGGPTLSPARGPYRRGQTRGIAVPRRQSTFHPSRCPRSGGAAGQHRHTAYLNECAHPHSFNMHITGTARCGRKRRARTRRIGVGVSGGRGCAQLCECVSATRLHGISAGGRIARAQQAPNRRMPVKYPDTRYAPVEESGQPREAQITRSES